MKRRNKGFSLIELIVVISIMAIIVGVMAPQLLKYVKRAKIAADRDRLSTLYAVFVYAVADPDVNDDPGSRAVIAQLSEGKVLIDDIPADCLLYEEILSGTGWDSLSQGDYVTKFRMADPGSQIYVQNEGSIDKPMTMWITRTDETGGDDHSEEPDNWLDIHKCISIR